jgi:hypothetical protein
MLLYVEFISRRPAISLEEFHERAGRAQGTWADNYGDDRMIVNAGRSWRVGPEPEYLCVWHVPAYGLDRIDDWERLFQDSGEREHHAEFEAVARIDRAGAYTPIGEPSLTTEGRYLVEWLTFADVTDDQIAAVFAERASHHQDHALRCLARPLGALAPNGRGFAVWGLSSWGSADGLVRDLPDPASGVTVADASLYADFGHEQL